MNPTCLKFLPAHIPTAVLTDTLVVSLAGTAGDSYFSRDIITPYDNELIMGVPDEWRLNAKVVNDSEEIRGLGIILSQR